MLCVNIEKHCKGYGTILTSLKKISHNAYGLPKACTYSEGENIEFMIFFVETGENSSQRKKLLGNYLVRYQQHNFSY